MKLRIIFYFFLFLFYSLNIYSQENSTNDVSYKLSNIIALTPPNGYSVPKWSPDGNKILFSKLNYRGLYVINLTTEKKEIIELNKLNGAGFNAEWSEDSESIYYRHKSPDKHKKYKSHIDIKSIDIVTKSTIDHPKIYKNYITRKAGLNVNSDIIIYLDQNTLNVKACNLDKNKEWNITNEGRYVNPVASPDKSKIVVTKHGEMFVFATDGSGLICSLGRGIANSWSPDGEQILFFISEDDGHTIKGADIFVTNADGSQRWQVTNTPNIFEQWPDWSPDNQKIIFSDINVGTIYIADLIKNTERGD